MGMLDPNLLLDSIIASLKSNATLIAAIGGPDNVLKYTWENADGMNLDIAAQAQPVPSIMVCWLGTRTGNFNKLESIKHDYAIYLKPDDSITIAALYVLIREGQCTVPYVSKFKLLQVDVGVHPPDSLSCLPATRLIAANYASYDYPVVGFTLVERGIDN